MPKPEGMGINELAESIEHMYPASMIEFIEKSASMGGEVGEAFSKMHEEAEKLLAKAKPDVPEFGFPGLPGGLPGLPDNPIGAIAGAIGDRVAEAGADISSAGSKISKAVVGNLVGDVIFGSNPVTGVLLGISKTYKLTKKVRWPAPERRRER